jgi:hypothetical protein
MGSLDRNAVKKVVDNLKREKHRFGTDGWRWARVTFNEITSREQNEVMLKFLSDSMSVRANCGGQSPQGGPARKLETWQNGHYFVQLHRDELVPAADENSGENFPKLIWLTIRRQDRKPSRSWPDLMRIKDELVGEQNEAVELFPATSRLVDMANQYNLWVLEQPEITFPFGYLDRQVGAPPEPSE